MAYKPVANTYKRPRSEEIVGQQTQNVRFALEQLDEQSQIRLIVKIMNLAKQKLKPHELDRLAKSIQSTTPQEIGKHESATQTDTIPLSQPQSPIPEPTPPPSKASVPRETVTPQQKNNPTKKKIVNIPPITVTNRDSYKLVLKNIDEQDIKISQLTDTADGLRVYPVTQADHKLIKTSLDQTETQYFTHDLPEEKSLRVVVRGVLGVISLTELKDELTNLGFNITNISQMHRSANGTKTWLPLALIQLPKNGKSNEILQLTHIRQIRCKVETQRHTKQIAQCHRCQRFGHSQTHCKLDPRCVKCSKDHFAYECTKTDSTPATCANCGKSHPASYRGCEAFPNNKTKKRPNTPRQTTRPELTKPSKSYATVTKSISKDNILNQITDLLKKLIS